MRVLLRVLGVLIAIVVPLQALFLWMVFSEVVDDGLPLTGPSLVARTVLATAPFGLTPIIVSLLAGCLYWLVTPNEVPSAFALILGVSIAAMGFVACAGAAEVYLRFAHLDGGREPTILMWVANLALIFTLIAAIGLAWRRIWRTRKHTA